MKRNSPEQEISANMGSQLFPTDVCPIRFYDTYGFCLELRRRVFHATCVASCGRDDLGVAQNHLLIQRQSGIRLERVITDASAQYVKHRSDFRCTEVLVFSTWQEEGGGGA